MYICIYIIHEIQCTIVEIIFANILKRSNNHISIYIYFYIYISYILHKEGERKKERERKEEEEGREGERKREIDKNFSLIY